MSNQTNKKIVGIPWYKLADYPRILEIIADRNSHPDTFEEWEQIALNVERQLVNEGMRAVRVSFDPDKFIDWCSASRLARDAKGRGMWAAHAIEAITRGPRNG